MKTELRRAFGARLKAIREERGMTQAEVAVRLASLGIHRDLKTLTSKTEIGEREPSLAELIALAQIYQVSVGALFDGAGIGARDVDRLVRAEAELLAMQVIATALDQLRPDERARALAYLNDRFGGPS